MVKNPMRIKTVPLAFLYCVLLTVPLFVVAVETKTVNLGDPLNLSSAGEDAPFELYGRLIKGFTGIAGAAALFFFIYGGFQWLISGGNEEKIKKGKATITSATIGLAIILGSYLILSYVISVVTGAVE